LLFTFPPGVSKEESGILTDLPGKMSMKKRLEAVGHWFFYMTMRVFGHGGGSLLLVPVIFIYVLFSRRIHRTVRPYLVHRFPGEGAWKYWQYTYKNLLSFGQVLVDRGWIGLTGDSSFSGQFIGYDSLVALIKKNKGVVLLTGHVGNWQAALAHLDGLPAKVHALMRYDRQAVAKHFFDIRGKRSFEIIDADGPFGGMIDAAAALQRGEVVTIMGDRLAGGSSSTVDFLGESMRLPDAAYLLAATAGAPVVVLLAAKTGRKTYQLKVWDYFYPGYEDRSRRAQMLRECAGKYIAAMEQYLRQYPFQWYNFYNIWKQ
jgi:predicted LPLAT superfamily acyltransferase